MKSNTPHRQRPTREEIFQLPLFLGLPLESIQTPSSAPQLEATRSAIEHERIVGFDTESKPTFAKDVVRAGPHVIQLALPDRAYIVQVHNEHVMAFLKSILESDQIVKVGFGLRSDRPPLASNLGIQLRASIDLSNALRGLGYKDA